MRLSKCRRTSRVKLAISQVTLTTSFRRFLFYLGIKVKSFILLLYIISSIILTHSLWKWIGLDFNIIYSVPHSKIIAVATIKITLLCPLALHIMLFNYLYCWLKMTLWHPRGMFFKRKKNSKTRDHYSKTSQVPFMSFQ